MVCSFCVRPGHRADRCPERHLIQAGAEPFRHDTAAGGTVTDPPPADLAPVLAAVAAAVARLLAEGRSERVVVHVNPSRRRVLVVPPSPEELVEITLGETVGRASVCRMA